MALRYPSPPGWAVRPSDASTGRRVGRRRQWAGGGHTSGRRVWRRRAEGRKGVAGRQVGGRWRSPILGASLLIQEQGDLPTCQRRPCDRNCLRRCGFIVGRPTRSMPLRLSLATDNSRVSAALACFTRRCVHQTRPHGGGPFRQPPQSGLGACTGHGRRRPCSSGPAYGAMFLRGFRREGGVPPSPARGVPLVLLMALPPGVPPSAGRRGRVGWEMALPPAGARRISHIAWCRRAGAGPAAGPGAGGGRRGRRGFRLAAIDRGRELGGSGFARPWHQVPGAGKPTEPCGPGGLRLWTMPPRKKRWVGESLSCAVGFRVAPISVTSAECLSSRAAGAEAVVCRAGSPAAASLRFAGDLARGQTAVRIRCGRCVRRARRAGASRGRPSGVWGGTVPPS